MGGGRFCILPNLRTRGLSEAAIEGSERVVLRRVKILKRSQVRSRSGQRSKSPLSALSTAEVALITDVNPNFVKKDYQRMKKVQMHHISICLSKTKAQGRVK